MFADRISRVNRNTIVGLYFALQLRSRHLLRHRDVCLMCRYVTLRDFYSNKSGQHCARAWASTTILRPTCARANVISITNKLNTAPRAGCRRAEHRTLLATCVKLKGGRDAGTRERARARAREDEQRRIHENTPGVFHQFSLDLPRYVLWHVFLWPRILYS